MVIIFSVISPLTSGTKTYICLQMYVQLLVLLSFVTVAKDWHLVLKYIIVSIKFEYCPTIWDVDET